MGVALSHAATMSCQRLIRLDGPDFTRLPRFLAPEGSTYGLGIVQNNAAALAAEVRALANPVSTDSTPVAGDIEDRATNSALVVDRVARAIEAFREVLGMELLHAAQAVDFRRQATPGLALGSGTAPVYAAFRKEVAFLDRDRGLAEDLRRASVFVKGLGGSPDVAALAR
jgi:histidine ammonia-lyase